jgi:acyl carrier protein
MRTTNAAQLQKRLAAISPAKQAILASRLDELGIARPGKAKGVGGSRLIAYVVTDDNPPGAKDRLRVALTNLLPHYMVPSEFMILDSLPLTNNGKIDRAALPLPEADGTESQTLAGPRDDIEAVVSMIWQDVLEIDQLDIHADFFALGGHSLLATQIQYSIKELFHVALPVRSLFESTTVAKLSEAIIAHESEPGQTAKIARAMVMIEGLSDEEAIDRLEKGRDV